MYCTGYCYEIRKAGSLPHYFTQIIRRRPPIILRAAQRLRQSAQVKFPATEFHHG
jgi:hypothetical protein